MFQLEKQVLPNKLNKILIKLKSYTFMKIFMVEESIPKKFQKIRHYDLQLEATAAIAGWMKKKLQQVYLRHFYKIKHHSDGFQQEEIIHDHSSPSLKTLQIQQNNKDCTFKPRPQTDRHSYQQFRIPSSYSTQQMLKKPKKNPRQIQYKSQFGQSELSSNTRKSKLQNLLKKVRQVNTTTKFNKDKDNLKNPDSYDVSYENSRVMSNICYSQNNRKSIRKNQPQRDQRHNHHHNTTFSSYGRTEMASPNTREYDRHNETLIQSPVGYQINSEKDAQFEKNNLISLKKWHKTQKRNIIMAKISELQNSLYAEYSGQQDYFQNDYEMFPSAREIYNFSPKYSQGYLNLRSGKQAPMSLIDVKDRRF